MVKNKKQAISSLSERDEQVLAALIRDYVRRGVPVGSQRIVDISSLPVRAATIRAILHRLEESGFLYQPHTSAGRIPTAKGYRYYIDYLMAPQKPGPSMQRKYQRFLKRFARDMDRLIEQTSRFLGAEAASLVIISKPVYALATIKSVQLVDLDAEHLLLVVHLNHGYLKTTALKVRNPIPRSALREAEAILEDLFGGYTLEEVINLKEEHRKRLPVVSNSMVDLVLTNLKSVIESLTTPRYTYYGTYQLLQYPEFAEAERIEPLLEHLEDQTLYRDLPVVTSYREPQVFISSEAGRHYLKPFSVLSIRYAGNFFEGTIHLIGPMRMYYERNYGWLTYTAEEISRFLGRV